MLRTEEIKYEITDRGVVLSYGPFSLLVADSADEFDNFIFYLMLELNAISKSIAVNHAVKQYMKKADAQKKSEE